MLKMNKWIAILCASTSVVSTVGAYNLFFKSNTTSESNHEAKKEPHSKTYELENKNVDSIASNCFRPECRLDGGPDDPPPHVEGDGSVALPLIKENIAVCRKKSQKLRIENIINSKYNRDGSDKKVNIPEISIPSLKINNHTFGQQSKDFVSHMNHEFPVVWKKSQKNYTKSIESRLEFVNNFKKNSSNQTIKDFSQQFNSLIPDPETKDFISMIGGADFRESSTAINAVDNTVSERGAKKSNHQNIIETNSRFNVPAKNSMQNDAYDNVNIDALKKQTLQENDSATPKSAERKSNNQKIQELKNQLSDFAKTSTKKYNRHRKNTHENTVCDGSSSSDDKVLKHTNYSFDDDNSSSNVFSVDIDNVNVDSINDIDT